MQFLKSNQNLIKFEKLRLSRCRLPCYYRSKSVCIFFFFLIIFDKVNLYSFRNHNIKKRPTHWFQAIHRFQIINVSFCCQNPFKLCKSLIIMFTYQLAFIIERCCQLIFVHSSSNQIRVIRNDADGFVVRYIISLFDSWKAGTVNR